MRCWARQCRHASMLRRRCRCSCQRRRRRRSVLAAMREATLLLQWQDRKAWEIVATGVARRRSVDHLSLELPATAAPAVRAAAVASVVVALLQGQQGGRSTARETRAGPWRHRHRRHQAHQARLEDPGCLACRCCQLPHLLLTARCHHPLVRQHDWGVGLQAQEHCSSHQGQRHQRRAA